MPNMVRVAHHFSLLFVPPATAAEWGIKMMPKKVRSIILMITLISLLGCTGSRYSEDLKFPTDAEAAAGASENLQPNVATSFNPEIETPEIEASAFIHPQAAIIGNVHIGKKVFVGPFASVRGDEGEPIWIGDLSNVQDGVVIHALETQKEGKPVNTNLVEKDGKTFAVYIGNNVSLAHQSQIHGPALVDDEVFIGMQALVFKAKIGKGALLEPGAKVIGVNIPPGRYIGAGQTVASQAAADKLPQITKDYAYYGLNDKVLHVNLELVEGYKKPE